MKLNRGASGAGTSTAAAAAGTGTPAFERSYSGTHYMSMGWFNSPPKKYRGVGIFDADLHQSGQGVARADR